MAWLVAAGGPVVGASEAELHPFHRTWMRTDKPVADGAAARTWMWGPLDAGAYAVEPYDEAPEGEREVVYFDKSRMEITHPNATDDGVWYVTNGLLVTELVSGRLQLGDARFELHAPAEVHIAADPGQRPTYADIERFALRDQHPLPVGSAIDQRYDDGVLAKDPSLDAYGVTAAERVTVPGIDHTVASPFWAFMTSQGPVYEQGQWSTANLFVNPYYATGYPITEAWWSRISVDGTVRDVLWQCFERRCLTYTPSNPAGWQVEAGNVGLHYYQWRYGAVRPEPERLTVTFRLFHDGEQIATTVTSETFFGDTAVGTWTTTDPRGALLSRGTLDADHTLTSIDAWIIQDWPFTGTAELRFDASLGLGGVTGAGTVTYTAQTPEGNLTGTVAFEATTTSLDVWDITLEDVPPVLFGGS